MNKAFKLICKIGSGDDKKTKPTKADKIAFNELPERIRTFSTNATKSKCYEEGGHVYLIKLEDENSKNSGTLIYRKKIEPVADEQLAFVFA